MPRSILDYFSKEHCKVDSSDPRSPLSSKMLPSTIAVANTEVMHVINGPSELELKCIHQSSRHYSNPQSNIIQHNKFSRVANPFGKICT